MLDRELFDSISWWPWSVPFMLFQTVLFTLFRFNKALEQQGIFTFQLYKGPIGTGFGYLFYFFANVFSIAMFIFFCT